MGYLSPFLNKKVAKKKMLIFLFHICVNECHFLLGSSYNAVQLTHKYSTTETGNDSNDRHKSIQIDI